MDYHLNRSKIFLLKGNEGKSFDHDPNLPPLPLPKLEETLECYFESLKPFGIPAELAISRKIVDEFKNGFGKTLQEIVEERSWSKKNWINDWWEKYRYHILRFPLYPYVVMGLPLPLQSVGVPENEDYSLKAAARCLYHKIEFWDLLRRERIRPVAPPDGMKYFSMEIFKRLFCTSRIPGEPFDRLDKHFKTVSEGECPTHGIIIAKGRIFQFNCVRLNGNLITPQEILRILHYIRGVVDTSVSSDNIPILTCDDRSSWAKNRKYLEELSRHNAQLLKIIESSVVMACLDNHSPKDYSESSQLALTGDFHSKWADRSNIMVIFRNGKISLIGEPSAYDGRCSISFAFFLLLGLLEMREPDWYQVPTPILLSPVEHIFNLDERLRKEIVRVLNDCDDRRDEITVSYKSFNNYGRKFIADNGMHWDSYIQMAIQLTYYKMHRKYPSTQETIQLRNFHNGRTDALKYFSEQTAEFLQIATNPKSTRKQVVDAFRKAAISHTKSRSTIKEGKGMDRHLFGLYCAAREGNWNIPELFHDPLFVRSGGHRKFTLSTSTSGFTAINIFTAPMITEGYGVFYNVTINGINFIITAWKTSPETSAHKFSSLLCESLREIKSLIKGDFESKL